MKYKFVSKVRQHIDNTNTSNKKESSMLFKSNWICQVAHEIILYVKMFSYSVSATIKNWHLFHFFEASSGW